QRPPLTKRTVPRCGRRRRAEPPARPSARSWQGAELGSELRGARRLLHGADTRRHPLCIPQHRGDARILECHAGRFEGRCGIRRHRAAQAIEVGVRLHVDLSVAHTHLDRLVDERPLGADRDHREEVLDVLGIEARAAVADQHADAPRNVRAVDAIGLERELEAILAERVVGCTARNAPSRVAELADVILANARRDVPGWIDGLADHREAAFGRPAIVATEPERIGADYRDAWFARGTLEIVQAQLRDVHDDSLVVAARKDPGRGNDQLRADLRSPQIHARIRVRDLVHSEVVVARDVEERLVRADDVAADLADHGLHRRPAGLGCGDAVGPHRLVLEDLLGESGSRDLRLRRRPEWRRERVSLRGTSRQQDAGERDGCQGDSGHGAINFDARRRVKPGLDSKKTHERAGRGPTRSSLRRPRGSRRRQGRQGLQWIGSLERSGLRQSGPRPLTESGRLIMARGPAWCSPLNGVTVGAVAPGSHPRSKGTCGSLNQKPTWKGLVGSRPTTGSTPKIWSTRTVCMVVTLRRSFFTSRSDWYQARPKLLFLATKAGSTVPSERNLLCSTVNMSKARPGLMLRSWMLN